MINPGDIIKHKAAKDTAVYIISSLQHPLTQDIEIKGIWINQGFVNTYEINILAEFTIKKEHLNNWLKSLNPNAKCIRYEEWKSLV